MTHVIFLLDYPLLILLANSGSRCRWSHESLEAGLAGCGRTFAGSPPASPHQIDRRRGQNMREMGVRRTPIAGPSDANGPDGLSASPFNASALGILDSVRLGLLTRPGGLSAHRVFRWSHGDGPPLGTGTIKAAGARLAITRREGNRDDFMVLAIRRGSPTAARLSHRTPGLPLWPVPHTLTGSKALSRACRPCVIGSCRAQPVHAVVPWAGDEPLGVQVARSNDMEVR